MMLRMSDIPVKFDWVEARAACTVAEVFEQLRMDVESDVEAANVARKLESGTKFIFKSSEAGNAFAAAAYWGRVQFVRHVDHIEIQDEVGNQKLTVTLTLSNTGRCKLKIEQEDMEQWQVRRMALEGLLFGPIVIR